MTVQAPLEEILVARLAEVRLFGGAATLGRYVLKEELGRGGWAVVYSAHDPVLDREVALKILRAGREKDPDALKRVLREARALARLRHPNVVQVFDA